MALLFCDGFDHYATADILKKWTAMDGSAPTISATAGRRGGGALVGTNAASITKTVPERKTLMLGMAFRMTTAPSGGRSIIEFREGSICHLSVAVSNSTGRLLVYRGNTTGTLIATGSLTLAANAYYYLEFKATIDNTVGAFTLRVNGAVELTQSGIDTEMAGGAGIVSVVLVGSSGSGGPAWNICDLYIADTLGASNNDLLGDVRIDTLFPNADGTYSAFAPSTGTAHYALVDEAAPSTTDYVASGVVGAKDSYALTDLSTAATVLGVQVCNLMYKDDAGLRSGANLVRSGTTDVQGATVALSTSPMYVVSMHETDPATGAAWTQAAVNAMEAGPVVAA